MRQLDNPRELLNVFHADAVGCHIITVTPDILSRLNLVDKDLYQYSLETVRMFHDDAMKAGFTLQRSRGFSGSRKAPFLPPD